MSRDRDKAIGLFRKAAKQEPPHVEARYRLAKLLSECVGADVDVGKFGRVSLSLADLDLPASIRKTLEASGVSTVQQVIGVRRDELITRLGEDGFNELREKIKGTWIDPWEETRKESAEHFLVAAELGHIEAQYHLGVIISEQQEDRFADRNALQWFRRAAEWGHRDAQFRVGQWLYHESGVQEYATEDPMGLVAEAIGWLRVAAERGHTKAMVLLAGSMYRHIPCLVRKYVTGREALTWLRKAARRGDMTAQYLLGSEALGKGWFLEPNSVFGPKDRLLLDRRKMIQRLMERRKWLRTAAKKGHREAQYKLAQLLGDPDLPFFRDFAAAEKWYREAAENPQACHPADASQAAQALLHYQRGRGAPKYRDMDFNFAIGRLDRAIELETELSNPNACGVLGEKLSDLERTEKRRMITRNLINAAELGHPEAQFQLGKKYEEGNGVEKDLSLACRWYRTAAEKGHVPAQDRVTSIERVNQLKELLAKQKKQANEDHDD